MKNLLFSIALAMAVFGTGASAQTVAPLSQTNDNAKYQKGDLDTKGWEVVDRTTSDKCAGGEQFIGTLGPIAQAKGGGIQKEEVAQAELAAFVAGGIPGPDRQLDLKGTIVVPSDDKESAVFFFVEKNLQVCYAVHITKTQFLSITKAFKEQHGA